MARSPSCRSTTSSASAPGSGAATPSDRPEALERFLELRRQASLRRIGDGGWELSRALTTALDRVVVELAAGAPASGTFAVVALGGYGRGEQCLHSDVDLMVLGDGAGMDATAAAIFRPLWDAGLKVGHSVRTPAEAGIAARQRLDTLTSLLSARLVAGDDGLFTTLLAQLAQVVTGKPLAPALAAAERERRRRHPYPVMAADLKEGRGGLRTIQGLGWERRRAELLGLGATAPTTEEREALATLLAVRNSLHAAAGRAYDVYSPELREPAARWLGRQTRVVSGMVTRALSTGDRLAEETWPDVLVADDPLRSFRRRMAVHIRSRFTTTGRAAARTPLVIASDAAERPGPLQFTDVERSAIVDAPGVWTAADRTALVRLIAAGPRGRAAFAVLERTGWVDAAFPEWAIVRAAPQLAPFHDHPVDAHLWRTVDEMRAIVEGKDEWLTTIVAEVGSTEELYLAAFFHDIGKGRGSDHSKTGAIATEAFCRRAGFGPATTAALVHAVAHHLLLAQTAFRRDLGRPEVIDDVVDAVGTLRRLQVLYLLSIADLRATGTAMWSEWKATLLRKLYVECAGQLERSERGTAGDEEGPTVDTYVAAAAAHERRVVEEHLAALPGDYRQVFDPEEVAWHLDVIAGRRSGIVVATRSTEGITEALVVADDEPGLLVATAAAFAAHGVDVLEAHLFTREDSLAVDRFVVRRHVTGERVADATWERVRRDLESAFAGTIDLAGQIAERARAYDRAGVVALPVEVTVVDDPAMRATAVTVRCGDRIGRLAQIVTALRNQDCDVHHAKLEVRGRQVVDTFLLRRQGHPLRSHEERASLAGALRTALER